MHSTGPAADQWHPSKTIPLAVIRLALAIIDYLVVEAERFHANTDDLEAQAIGRFKELAPVEYTWDKFKAKCKEPIRREGKKLWTNIVTAMRDASIGEVTKSNPLTADTRTLTDILRCPPKAQSGTAIGVPRTHRHH